MRGVLAAVVFLAVAENAIAQQSDQAVLYVPGGGTDSPGKVIFSTGAEAAVVSIAGDAVPADCPDGAFWVKNNLSLVNCTDGTAYRFVPPAGEYVASTKALGLELIKGPPFGTDDGGPLVDGANEGAQQ